MKLWLDRETYAEVDLKEVGAYQYSQTAEDLLIAYAIDDGPAQVWDCTEDPLVPTDLEQAMAEALEVWAHNAAFDRAVHNGPNQAHLPRIDLPRWRCTMALALSHALPGSLDSLCKVLRIPEDMAKLKEGKKLLHLFTRPQPANRKIRRATRFTHPAEWARFKLYAANDIVAMREAHKRMPKWNWDDTCVAEWHCDQRINERGFQVDQELTRAGAAAAIVEKERIGVRFRELTHDVVARPAQREQFKAYVSARFEIELPDTTKDTFALMIKNGESTGELKELMELSMASNKTSTAKYATLDPAVMADGRFRGGLQFAGAGRTRRWAGRLFQPQNLPSRGLPPAELVELYIECLKLGTHDLFFDDLMRYGAAALRGVVIPRPGTKLSVADLSNIEGRVLAWVAGEAWKLVAFRDYDAGTGPDLYKVTAGIITGVDPWKVAKEIRNSIGKVADLASGFQGGVAGYQKFSKNYGVKMADYWDVLQRTVAPELVEKAHTNLATWGAGGPAELEISEVEWLASEVCKLAWRARHPATVKFWYALQDAAKSAIRDWGSIHSVGRYIKVKGVTYAGNRWLVVRLPSGRFLTYFQPRLLDDGISYMGDAAEEGKTTRQWTNVYTHGGKMTGNCLSKETIILTNTGMKPITQVTRQDRVWDGCDWVATDGVISQGRKEVGIWLGVRITQDHLIHDGNLWKPVTQLGECSTHDALVSALGSVHLRSFAVTPQTQAMQNVFANAELLNASMLGSCGKAKAFVANPVSLQNSLPACEKTTTLFLTTNCGKLGLTDTNTSCEDAPTPSTLPMQITEDEGSPYVQNGWLTEGLFSGTSKHFQTGTPLAWTSTESTTTGGMNPETFGSLPAASTPTTLDVQPESRISELKFRSQLSGENTVRNTKPETPFDTTWTPAEQQNGLWKNTMRHEEVFDLLNCGPRNRFTILTNAGPVVVHNCVQTTARDILAPAMQMAEDRGYLPVLTVHDEIITEVPDNCDYSAKGLAEILSTNPVWAPDLPLAAAGFEGYRYKKD